MTWRSAVYLEAVEKDAGKTWRRRCGPRKSWSAGGRDEARKLFAKIRGTGSGLSGADELKL